MAEPTRIGRRAIAPLFCLLGISLSCAIAPAPMPMTVTSLPEAPVSAPSAQDHPAYPAVRAHMERYAQRSGLTEEERDLVARTILEESVRHELDPALVVAVIHVESRFDAYAVSPVYALGLMQVMPATDRRGRRAAARGR
jgi:soluble lytic murein transglycosylase-like protein